MEENEEPCKGQVSAVSDTGPAGPAMSNAMLNKEYEVERRVKQVLVLQWFACEQVR